MMNSPSLFFLGLIFFMTLFVKLKAEIPSNLFLDFDQRANKHIDKAERLYHQAESGIKNAVQAYEQGSNDIALKQLKDASDHYFKAYQKVYETYRAHIDEFWEENNENYDHMKAMLEAIEFEKKAQKRHNKPERYRNQLKQSANFKEAVSLHNKAYEHEVHVLTYTGRALQVYQEFPVQYPHNWQEIEVDFVHVGQQEESSKDMMAEKVVENPAPEKNDTTLPSLETDDYDYKDIVYRIQIAAHMNPIGTDKLNSIYSGERKVEELHEDGWWKYLIGKYKSFDEALDAMQELNVEKAFVAAYVEGKRVSINKKVKEELVE